jgi:hypothetical protein
VTQHHGIEAAGVADAALGEVVQIGATNADRFYRHLNLAWFRIRDRWNIRDLELMGAG